MRARMVPPAVLLALALVAGASPVGAQDSGAIVYSAYRYGGRGAGAAIFTLVPGEERVRLTGSRSFNLEPVWAPDHSRIAYVHHDRPRNPDIWLMDPDGRNKTRLTTGRRDDVYPQWSPDGSHIAWVKGRFGGSTGQIFVMHPDGHDKMAVSPRDDLAAQPSWSPDGRRLAYVVDPRCDDCEDDTEIHVVDAHTGEDHMVLTSNLVDDVNPVWSPDGDRIVVARERENGGDLFTMAPDGTNERQLTSLDGYAFLPRWSPDGSEVAFTLLVDADDFHTRLGVVDVATGETRLLTDVATGGILPSWSPDGDRIAFLGFHSGGYEIGAVGRDGMGLTRLTSSGVDEAWLDW